MNSKALVVWFGVGVCPVLVAGQATSQNPLARHYREGEKLVYRMTGINEQWHYTIRAEGEVKRDASGRYFEEYRWADLETVGQAQPLIADQDTFRQRLTLDPDVTPSAPDLTRVDPRLIGPITDFMTFYSDLWLANKLGQLKKPGDHFYFRNPMPPGSWADGSRVLIGESMIDFDLTLKSVDAAGGTAVLEVRHVPPDQGGLHPKAKWMEERVGTAPNNWQTVSKGPEGYEAGIGQETFTVEITLSLADGKIEKASLDNLVKTTERTCDDEALTKCGPAKPHEISRKIEIALQE